MKIFKEYDQNQAYLLLPSLEDFVRSEHADSISQIFIEVVRLCASLGMVGLGHIAFDGTKLKANASVRQTREKESQLFEFNKPLVIFTKQKKLDIFLEMCHIQNDHSSLWYLWIGLKDIFNERTQV